jgi:hypothetical protein
MKYFFPHDYLPYESYMNMLFGVNEKAVSGFPTLEINLYSLTKFSAA